MAVEERLPEKLQQEDAEQTGEEREEETPKRYVPLRDLYSTTTACGKSSNVVSKKVKVRKLNDNCHNQFDDRDQLDDVMWSRPPVVHVYCRRPKMTPVDAAAFVTVKEEVKEIVEEGNCREEDVVNGSGRLTRKRKLGLRESTEQVKLGKLRKIDGSSKKIGNTGIKRRRNNLHLGNDRNNDESPLPNSSNKRWVRLGFNSSNANKLVGLKCKVYWPLDDKWYIAHLSGYNADTDRHHIVYEDGDEENLDLSREKIKIFISGEEERKLNLSCNTITSDINENDFSEMVVLAASFDDCQELGPGDIIWAKVTGHAMWPAIVVEENLITDCKGLNRDRAGNKSVPVQFFGTHDFARVNMKQVISFLRGLLSSFQLKCKKPHFVRSLEEAKMYLCEQKLPERMLHTRNSNNTDVSERRSRDNEFGADSDEDCFVGENMKSNLENFESFPLQIGDFQVITLGKIVNSKHFQNDKFIWPEGYTAVRKLPSLTSSDPTQCTTYKMEVTRDNAARTRPLFIVTIDGGEQFKGSTPSSCWQKVYDSVKDMNDSYHSFISEGKFRSGSDMFGFSNPEVLKLIRKLSNSKASSKSHSCKMASERSRELPIGYRPVRVKWKDLDKCLVCHMDEEYVNNLFLQCDKCRMMVHTRCYGEVEPVDGVIWLCQLCRPEAPQVPICCCLCPVTGGAMKRTTDGQWAHLACAMWIPETCLSDIKKMEPIGGIDRINKDRWKLLCSICGVAYGACIQCSNNTCRVAYHPLCARAAGFCAELAVEERLHNISMDEDEDGQCIRLLSFCKKHRPVGNERSKADHRTVPDTCQEGYTPPTNPSGCARCEPYNWSDRRGRKEPEVLAAASLKRLYVENMPYLVGGYRQHEFFGNSLVSSSTVSKVAISLQKLNVLRLNAPESICSMAEKYRYMRATFKKRLAFGKSRIHGYGIFTKLPHRAGDMVIEYTGELVRPCIADRREHLTYNLLVGAGTYMFRVDDEQVIDATRAGSVAHLINHSCEPNCYSRVISANGDQHIIIFAKRDIKQWEEITYDYRFFSIGEQLACYCGAQRCRGVVNDTEAEEQASTLCVQRRVLTEWRG
ncbi:histone-lysine N-methyltransferase ATX2-like [Impatiens glandulifera]|uniref:histone-lysine N-methyltransferase ATX2-like n=1 Tax=Impatiens glandulifera TaxID=253017 RepID=UPI001FB0D262|nr:histone-lysine N-methyltransferase ATX2-like [Impatiens glandulifera]